jgi:hypothetical protein
MVIPTDCRSVAYLARFMDVTSQICAIELCKIVFGVYILHQELSWSTIRPHTPWTCNLASACDEFVYPTYISILSRVFKVWRVDAFPGLKNLKAFVATYPLRCYAYCTQKIPRHTIWPSRPHLKWLYLVTLFWSFFIPYPWSSYFLSMELENFHGNNWPCRNRQHCHVNERNARGY